MKFPKDAIQNTSGVVTTSYRFSTASVSTTLEDPSKTQ